MSVGQDSLAVDDDPGAAGLLRAVLGPRMSQVGLAHRRADLDDRFADLALLGVALGRSSAGEAKAGMLKNKAVAKAGTGRPAVIQPEIIRRMFIAGLACGCRTPIVITAANRVAS